MKIKYAFLDGTVTEVEVSDEIGAVIIDSRKAEHAQDERHRYHCYSYDAIDYEGEEYHVAGQDLCTCRGRHETLRGLPHPHRGAW